MGSAKCKIVKTTDMNMSPSIKYSIDNKTVGLKKGDIVKVTRIASSYEDGWNNEWYTIMNDFIGETGKVLENIGNKGIKVSFDKKDGWPYATCTFPFYILKKRTNEDILEEAKRFKDVANDIDNWINEL